MRTDAFSCARAGAVALALLVAAGCGGPRVQSSPTDPRYEFEIGRAEFGRTHWLEAQTHLKRFLDLHPGHAVADSAQLLLGLAKSRSKSYAEAAVEFAILAREYPRSGLRDEASYEECVCYFEQMRPAQLDPTFANRAQSCFREFLLRYPDSEQRPAAEKRLLDIDDRLAEKDFRIGKLFANMNQPHAARVYLEAVLQDYPRSRWAPHALLWLGRTQDKGGEPAAALESYRRLLETFPDSDPARDARHEEQRLLGRHPELRPGAATDASRP